MRRTAILTAALISTASCLPFGSVPSRGRPVLDVYHDAGGAAPDAIRIVAASPLARDKSVPLIYPPEIFPVYVPTHVDRERDMMVGEHYLFIKLADSTWLADKIVEEEPRADKVSAEEELRLLRERMGAEVWEKAIVPYAPGAKP